MNDKLERKNFIIDIWAKSYPSRRRSVYGFLEYDKNLCNYINQNVSPNSKLLEVAIGFGFPFADYLQKSGYSIYGIDISPYLIEECRKLNPLIICEVGDAEKLGYEDNYFDATYCLHSTWYFNDLLKAVDEMIRVTKPGGMVLFDIQNRNNKKINDGYLFNITQKRGVKRIIKFVKDIVSIIMCKTKFNWHFLFHYIVFEIPTFPEDLYGYLNKKGINFNVMIEKDGSIIKTDKPGPFPDYSRLVFVLYKKEAGLP